MRDLLDFHAAGRGRHDHDPLGFAVEHEAQVEFALPFHRRLDPQARNQLAARTGLLGHQGPAQQVLGGGLDLAVVAAQLDTARLAAPAGMDLRLDHPGIAADLACPVGRLLGTVRQAPARHRHAEPGQQLLGLILVNVHSLCPCPRPCRILCPRRAARPTANGWPSPIFGVGQPYPIRTESRHEKTSCWDAAEMRQPLAVAIEISAMNQICHAKIDRSRIDPTDVTSASLRWPGNPSFAKPPTPRCGASGMGGDRGWISFAQCRSSVDATGLRQWRQGEIIHAVVE